MIIVIIVIIVIIELLDRLDRHAKKRSLSTNCVNKYKLYFEMFVNLLIIFMLQPTVTMLYRHFC